MNSTISLHDFTPKRIALIKPSALGDIMHSLPVLTALRQRFPQAHITWVVNRLYEPLLQNHPDLDATLPFDRQLMRTGWMSGARTLGGFLSQLRASRFDLVIDLQGLLRTGLMSVASGAPRRLGLASAREAARCFYTHTIDDSDIDHAVDRYWRVIEALGGRGMAKQFRLPIDDTARQWARRQLADCPRPWLAVGVGARWLTKRWPPEHFATLVRQAQRRFGGTALFVGAPDEQELSRAAVALLHPRGSIISWDGSPEPSHNMHASTAGVRDFTGSTTLPQLAALLSEADVLIANDTGPLHLAVALGRPVVAPYTCTVVRRTGPYGQEGRAVQTAVWCAGSYVRQCDRLECMAELSPARLWPALEEILRTWQQLRPSA